MNALHVIAGVAGAVCCVKTSSAQWVQSLLNSGSSFPPTGAFLEPSVRNGEIAYTHGPRIVVNTGYVIGDNTPYPGSGGGTINGIGSRVSFDGSNIDFVAASTSGQSGLFSTSSGSITTLVDSGTALPGGFGHHGSMTGPSRDGAQVAFRATNPQRTGIFRWSSGQVTTVVDNQTPVPGSASTFSTFGDPMFRGGRVAFVGSVGGTPSGLYERAADAGGAVEVIADRSTAAPEGGSFVSFYALGFDGQNAAFAARATTTGLYEGMGVYARINGQIQRVLTGPQLTALVGLPSYRYAEVLSISISGTTIAMSIYSTEGFPQDNFVGVLRNGAWTLLGSHHYVPGTHSSPRVFSVAPESLNGDAFAYGVNWVSDQVGYRQLWKATYVPSVGSFWVIGFALAFQPRRRTRRLQ